MAPRITDFDCIENDAALISCDENVNAFMDDTDGEGVTIWRSNAEVGENEEDDDSSALSQDDCEDDEASVQRVIYSSPAFDEEDDCLMQDVAQPEDAPHDHPRLISSLDPQSTSFEDLAQMLARGIQIPDLLQAVIDTNSPRLICLAMRLLSDCARYSSGEGFSPPLLGVVTELLGCSSPGSGAWLQKECAALVIRILTAREEMDSLLLSNEARHLLPTLARVAQGEGPTKMIGSTTSAFESVSEQARVHATIALMNLSCGSATNKAIMANNVSVLLALKSILLDPSSEALHLRATVALKNLSSLECNDRALIQFPGLVHTLGQVIWRTTPSTAFPNIGPMRCTVNACMVLMNLSISEHHAEQIYCTQGVMQSLMKVLEITNNITVTERISYSTEARLAACSVLSNLAIGYGNKGSMLCYPGLLDSLSTMVLEEPHESIRSKACSVLWSLAAKKDNQRAMAAAHNGRILFSLVKASSSIRPSNSRQKCVAALALLAESPQNAIPLIEAGVLVPLLHILNSAGTDPNNWTEPTASWCVTCIMNLAQSDEAVPILIDAGIVQLLSPLVDSDHKYQSLKAAIAVTLCCRSSQNNGVTDDLRYYNLLRRVETAIPRITDLVSNTLNCRGGEGYQYGVFTLSSSIACIAVLASGPEYIRERVCTKSVLQHLLCVLWEFAVDGGTCGRVVGGGRDDFVTAGWAVEALTSVLIHLVSNSGGSNVDGANLVLSLKVPLLRSFKCTAQRFLVNDKTNKRNGVCAALAAKAQRTILELDAAIAEGKDISRSRNRTEFSKSTAINTMDLPALSTSVMVDRKNCTQTVVTAGLGSNVGIRDDKTFSSTDKKVQIPAVLCTFILSDELTGKRYVVPAVDQPFVDVARQWCFRRGRFCGPGESPDPTYVWTMELQQLYELLLHRRDWATAPSAVVAQRPEKNHQP